MSHDQVGEMAQEEGESPFDGCPECDGPMGYVARGQLECRRCGEEYHHENREGQDLLWSYTLNYRLDEVVLRG